MPIRWKTPLSYPAPPFMWHGEVAVGKSAVAVLCFAGDTSTMTSGDVPDDRTRRAIENRLNASISSCSKSVGEIIAPALELRHRQWRRDAMTAQQFRNTLNLHSVNLFQGHASSNYLATFDVGDVFDGYRLQIISDGKAVTNARLQPPMGADGLKRMMPNLSQAKSTLLLESASPKKRPTHTSAKHKVQIKWVAEPKYDRKRRKWIGVVAASRREVVVVADAAQSKTQPAWLNGRIGQALSQLSAAMNDVVPQIADLYNDSWADDREVSNAAVKRRISIDSVEINDSDDWSLWLGDGDLFDGHWIRVDVDADANVSFELLG